MNVLDSHQTPMARQTGTTLIEVLITMLVTAIALLGLAGIQIRAQQEHQIAHLRMVAIEKGNQILEEARNTYRLSRDGATAFSQLPGFTTTAPTVTCGLSAAGSASTNNAPCSAAQMWGAMRSLWLIDLKSKLPNPAVLMTHVADIDAVGLGVSGLANVQAIDVAPHPVLTVTIAWREPQVDSTAIDASCALSGNTTFANAVAGYRCIYLTTNL